MDRGGQQQLNQNRQLSLEQMAVTGVVLFGGMAMGTRPAPSISEMIENLIALYQARHLNAPTEESQQVWIDRLKNLGALPLTTK